MAGAVPKPVETYRRAVRELDDARAKSDRLQAREAGEKAWLAVVEATARFLAEHNIIVEQGPRAHVGRRTGLTNLGREDLRRTYSDLAESLHGEYFYADEGDTGANLDALFAEAAQYVENVTGEKGLRRPKRQDPDLIKDLRRG